MKFLLFFLAFAFSYSLSFGQNSHVKHSLGCNLLRSEVYNQMTDNEYTTKLKTAPKKTLPDSIFLNTPPVKDQGTQNSCVGWGVGYTFFSTIQTAPNQPWDESNERSPSFIYDQVCHGNCQNGAYVVDALSVLSGRGDCSIKKMSYNQASCVWPNDNQFQEAWDVVPHARIFAIPTTSVYFYQLSLINNQPVVIAFNVDQSFDNMWNSIDGIWASRFGAIRGGHCVCIIGYDNTRQMFKAQNQWGTSGGDHHSGYFWITYDMIQHGCIKEAYCFATP